MATAPKPLHCKEAHLLLWGSARRRIGSRLDRTVYCWHSGYNVIYPHDLAKMLISGLHRWSFCRILFPESVHWCWCVQWLSPVLVLNLVSWDIAPRGSSLSPSNMWTSSWEWGFLFRLGWGLLDRHWHLSTLSLSLVGTQHLVEEIISGMYINPHETIIETKMCKKTTRL